MITTVDVFLEGIYFNRKPTGRIGLGSDLADFELGGLREFNFSIDSEKDTVISLIIQHYGKTHRDTQGDLDTAIQVNKININKIESPKFVWEGIYTPDYPVQYLKDYPESLPQLKCSPYMGWNGQWQLDIKVPAFTWIHQLEQLGWIYE